MKGKFIEDLSGYEQILVDRCTLNQGATLYLPDWLQLGS